MRKQLPAASGRGKVREKLRTARHWLRWVMPRVAVVAGVMFVVWLFTNETRAYKSTFIGPLFGFLTFLVVCFTSVYYGFKALRWLKRKLLWRVRRRLVITYLFVGLTPIILLMLFGLLSAFGGSAQGISRIVETQVNATKEQTLASARTLASDFSRLPLNADDRAVQSWLDGRAGALRGSLPGARVGLWLGLTGEDAAAAGLSNTAQFVSDLDDEMTRGVGSDNAPVGATLPEWTRGRMEWSGVAYPEPPEPKETFGAPSIRALVRGTHNNRPFVLLLSVPVSRALVQQYRESTGVNVRPFFVNSGIKRDGSQVSVSTGDGKSRAPQRDGQQAAQTDENEAERRARETFGVDQFGDPLQGQGAMYVVVLPATNWMSGAETHNLTFLFNWSWSLAGKQFLGDKEAGQVWQRALKIVGITFLVFEILALFAAAWMTRAVTGTVHKLYRATDYIKRGDFSHRVKVRSHDQLGELAEAFNEMSANIEGLLQERVEHERLEREIEIAAEVQAQLFPRRVPDLMTVEIAAECRAARGVAGDYYDYIAVAPGLVALALGDVSGKGISASLVMSNLQASLRAQTTLTAERLHIAERAVAVSAGSSDTSGAKLLAHVVADADMDGAVSRQVTRINEQLCQSTDANRFATFFLALYEDRARKLRYTNAGHNPPILVRANGTAERLTTGGMMVGAFDWATYEESSVMLEEGDTLLIFSDGISEAENEDGEEYTEPRLLNFAVEHRHLAAHELREAIFTEVDAWSGQRERGDDQTLVIVKCSGQWPVVSD